jgi:hypothetical protein
MRAVGKAGREVVGVEVEVEWILNTNLSLACVRFMSRAMFAFC